MTSDSRVDGRHALTSSGVFTMLALAPAAALGRLMLGLLGFAVRLALFRHTRTQGSTALLWGLAFGVYLWAGSLAFGLPELRAIPFALSAAALIGGFVYM